MIPLCYTSCTHYPASGMFKSQEVQSSFCFLYFTISCSAFLLLSLMDSSGFSFVDHILELLCTWCRTKREHCAPEVFLLKLRMVHSSINVGIQMCNRFRLFKFQQLDLTSSIFNPEVKSSQTNKSKKHNINLETNWKSCSFSTQELICLIFLYFMFGVSCWIHISVVVYCWSHS